MKAFVTGAAGFIGSHVVDHLLCAGHSIVGYDNFSTGKPAFLEQAKKSPRFQLHQGDILDLFTLTRAMEAVDVVFHLAAHADVRSGPEHPQRDLTQNVVGTSNVLEAMRTCNVKQIVFTSTGSVYGEPQIFPTPEDPPFPIQTSLYAASKLAAESLITAYCEAFNRRCWVFRLVSILGERYSHGHVFDFVKQLLEHPDHLSILGNGQQKKSYLYVQDCVGAMLLALNLAAEKVNIFNLGTDGYYTVNESIDRIAETMGLNPQRSYAGGERGWIGDSPFIHLDCQRIQKLGWYPAVSIQSAVERTTNFLFKNKEILYA